MKKTELVIVGAGPAGLSAAIYTGRAGVETLVFGCDPKFAGNYEIQNYFGFAETISGQDLQERGLAQARRFGAEIACERVLGIHWENDGQFKVKTEKGEYLTSAVILATGVSRVRPGIANLADYEGTGVSYCVSCDGFFFRGQRVAVIGEGNYAANQALELLNYTPNVSIYTQGKEPTMGAEFHERLAAAGVPLSKDKVVGLKGDGGLSQAELADGSFQDLDGLFVAMGEASSTSFALTLGLEQNGQFIAVDSNGNTNIPGVFAAGDCTGGLLQISVAVGEGAKVGQGAISYIRQLREKAKE